MRHRHAILHLPFAIAGDWLGFPLRVRAPQRFARCISKCMGLISAFFARPAPLGGRVDVADDSLPSVADVDVLDGHFLLALRAVFLQRRHLRGERSRQLVERTLCAVLLWDVIDMGEAPRERHGRIPAGFKSESVAGFLLELVAGFVGIRRRER